MLTPYTTLLLCLVPALLSGAPIPLKKPPAGEPPDAVPLAPSPVYSSKLALTADTFSWPESGGGFPNPFLDTVACNNAQLGKLWVCDPDKQINSNEVASLSKKIEGIITNLKCQCHDSCSKTHPMGRFSIGIAIAGNITGSGSELERAKQLSYNLRTAYWGNMKKCNDMIVIALSTTGRAVYISPDPVAAVHLDSECVSDILDRTKAYWEARNWYKALNETLDYVRNALIGGQCGTKSGLSVGQIVGIVVGVVVGVGLIVGLILLCVGFCRGWGCVVDTCFGICIWCILIQIQAFINAIIFSLIQSMFGLCGCEDCCECDPLDCIPADSPDAGGGAEY